jgi:hypothetical protein
MKRVIRRGPSCEEASVSATRVIENTRLATVIIEAAMLESTSRAPSGPTAKALSNWPSQRKR